MTKSATPHEAVQNVAWEMANPQGQQDLWPFVTFLLVVCVGPYFIYKMFPADIQGEEGEDGADNETAVVLFSYRASNPDEVGVDLLLPWLPWLPFGVVFSQLISYFHAQLPFTKWHLVYYNP